MRELPLCGKRGAGKVALVDNADYDLVAGFKWYLIKPCPRVNKFYVVRVEYLGKNERGTNRNKVHYLHRVLMGEPGGLVDHKDGDTLNNTRGNLRITDRSGNNANRKKQASTGSVHGSSYIGVTRYPGRPRPWGVNFKHDGRNYGLGYFESEEDAAKERDFFARLVMGEFARLNFPDYDHAGHSPRRQDLVRQFGGEISSRRS